jgi:hypothetical protein
MGVDTSPGKELNSELGREGTWSCGNACEVAVEETWFWGNHELVELEESESVGTHDEKDSSGDDGVCGKPSGEGLGASCVDISSERDLNLELGG